MLELILGRAGTGKTTLLRKHLAESTAPKTILIVPEQYTFESERALLMEYGAEAANRVQVYSYTRLAQAAFLQYGGGAGFERGAGRLLYVVYHVAGVACGVRPAVYGGDSVHCV